VSYEQAPGLGLLGDGERSRSRSRSSRARRRRPLLIAGQTAVAVVSVLVLAGHGMRPTMLSSLVGACRLGRRWAPTRRSRPAAS